MLIVTAGMGQNNMFYIEMLLKTKSPLPYVQILNCTNQRCNCFCIISSRLCEMYCTVCKNVLCEKWTEMSGNFMLVVLKHPVPAEILDKNGRFRHEWLSC
jgi:hypothetical protein